MPEPPVAHAVDPPPFWLSPWPFLEPPALPPPDDDE